MNECKNAPETKMYSATGCSLGLLASPNLGLGVHGGDWRINEYPCDSQKVSFSDKKLCGKGRKFQIH